MVEKLGVVEALDEAIGPIKQRARGLTGGELLVGMATAQLAGQDFLVGLDRVRADVAGQDWARWRGRPPRRRPGWRAGSPTGSGPR
ncbi:hypothetical protein [Georgenia yuyongxinii]